MLNMIEKIILEKQSIIYVIFDLNFQIITASASVNKFTDSPNPILSGDDIRDYFPELFGLETNCLEIANNLNNSLELEGIYREKANEEPIYFNLHISSIFYQKKNRTNFNY